VPAQGKECFSTGRAGSAMDQSRSLPNPGGLSCTVYMYRMYRIGLPTAVRISYSPGQACVVRSPGWCRHPTPTAAQQVTGICLHLHACLHAACCSEASHIAATQAGAAGRRPVASPWAPRTMASVPDEPSRQSPYT
jgi:hypothetical protein